MSSQATAADEFLARVVSDINKTKQGDEETASQLRRYLQDVADVRWLKVEIRRRILKVVLEKDKKLHEQIQDRLRAGIAVDEMDLEVNELLRKHDPDLLKRKNTIEAGSMRLRAAGGAAMKRIAARAKDELIKQEKLSPEEEEMRELLEKISDLL